MKLSTSLLVLAMAGTSLAQAPAPKNTTPAKPAATQTAPATATAKPTLPATSPSAKPAKSAVKTAAKPMAAKAAPKVAATKSEKPKEVKKEAAPAEAPAVEAKKDAGETPAPEMKRGRDPFVSVIMTRETTGAPCAGSGKKCLIIDQVMLKGIVRSQVGPIAVVTSSSNKTYFLRENDPVYNGVVVKITPDSIVFRETVTDRMGKSIQRDVVKKVNNPAA